MKVMRCNAWRSMGHVAVVGSLGGSTMEGLVQCGGGVGCCSVGGGCVRRS